MRSKENAMEFHQCYALDYHRARDKFRAAAAAAGASQIGRAHV